MSVNDPIADMLTRIRNGGMIGQTAVAMPNSKIKVEIARILKEEGFIESYEVVEGDKPVSQVLRLRLKYVGERRSRRPVITGIERISLSPVILVDDRQPVVRRIFGAIDATDPLTRDAVIKIVIDPHEFIGV
ncbi:MAG: 30S ribosomal protein S8, partial [Anaerolineaceae bacterium]|nr:30S ribosomal protein S8 [Anaerolineaceae bacterium]